MTRPSTPYDDEIELATRALAVTPGSAQANARLGALLAAAGKPLDAAACLSRALALDDRQADVWSNLGAVMQTLGRAERALACFERAIALDPSHVNAVWNAITALGTEQRYEDAFQLLLRLKQLDPGFAEIGATEGHLLFQRGHVQEAIDVLERAVKHATPDSHAWMHLNEAYVAIGRIDDAKQGLREAIERTPRQSRYYRALAEIDTSLLTGADIERLRALACEPDVSDDDRANAQLALGRAAERTGELKSAFDYFSSANAILRSRVSYDEAAELEAFSAIEKTFTAEALKAGVTAHRASVRPIFIFGMPRSGTTLLEQIIGSHPSVYPGGELSTLDTIFRQSVVNGGTISVDIAKRYEAAISALAPATVSCVTDKMPFNFRYAGVIRMFFANAKMIHISRSPLESCWSIFITRFADRGMSWSYRLDEIARYYRAYLQLIDHWRRVLPADSMLEVRYEDLVADFEPQTRRIIDYCGLPWDEACLHFHRSARAVQTASASQVRKPLYSSSVRRAHRYGELMRPLADAIGVEL